MKWKHIINEWRTIEPELLSKVEQLDVSTRYIDVPIIVDNVIDIARYDTESGKFISLIINVGVGPGIKCEFAQDAGYYDEVRKKIIKL